MGLSIHLRGQSVGQASRNATMPYVRIKRDISYFRETIVKYIACCVLLFALGLIGFSAQAQDQDYPYQLALERIEEARQTHADSVALPADLTRLPPELFTLTDIKTLNLSYMHLTTFPPEIGQMTNLVALHMCCGDLQSIPPEIGQMTNLVQLTLQSNRLTSIPSEISNLKHLK